MLSFVHRSLRQFVLVTPPQEPKALTRLWCLWELYNAIEHDCHIHFHTSGKLYGDFQNMMMKKKHFKTLVSKFGAKIDYKNAQAASAAHGDMLQTCIEGVGADQAVRLITQCTSSWLATKGDETIERLLRASTKGEEGKKEKKSALDACVIVAGLWKELDKLEKAEPSYRRVFELREVVLGKDHPRTIKAMQNLASLLQQLDSRATAKTGWKNLAGSLKGSKGWGGVHREGASNGKSPQVNYLAEAELLFRRALVKQEQVLGLIDPQTLQSINNFAVFCQKNQKLREAELLYRRALKGFEKAHGKMHSHTLQAGHNLASLLQEQGETMQAEEMYRTVYEGRVAVLGGEDPTTLQTLSRLGTVSQQLGNISEAAGIFHQLVEMHKEFQGDNAPETFHAMSMLASCMIDEKRQEEAEPLLRAVYEGRKTNFGMSNIDTLQAATDLANFCYDNKKEGNLKEAEELHKMVYDARKEILGKRNLDTLKTATKLAAVYFSQNMLQQAEDLYSQAYQGYKRKLGQNHSTTMLCVDMLARLLLKQDKFEAALPYYEAAADHYSSSLGPSHPDTLNMMGNCGVCLLSMNKLREGIAKLKTCVDELKNVKKDLEVNSPMIKSINKRLARFEKALEGQEEKLVAYEKMQESSKSDEIIESKSGEVRQGGWTNGVEKKKKQHIKSAGLGVMFANRLGKFVRPTAPSGSSPRSRGNNPSPSVGRRGPPRGRPPPGATGTSPAMPQGALHLGARPASASAELPNGVMRGARGRPRPPPRPPPTPPPMTRRAQSPNLRVRQSNV